VFAKVMNQSSQPLTRAGVITAFKAVSDLSTNGLTPPLDYAHPDPIKGYTADNNVTTVAHEIVDGKWGETGPVKFLNVLTGQYVAG
jgi:hypothetical protein